MAGARRSGLGSNQEGAALAGRSPQSRPGPLGLEAHEWDPAPDVVARVRESTWSQTVGEPAVAPPLAATPSAKAPKPVKEGWVEIEVVDGDGEPVVGQPYKLELADGRVMQGKLGSGGLIAVHGIDPGNVKVTFPTDA